MKRKTAREILSDSFRELAHEKPVDKITVKDIIANCGYSQATFYRQFGDKYDLIAWSYTQDLEQLLDQVRSDRRSWRQTLESVAAYFERHRKYLVNLLTHTSGYDSFVINMTAIHCRSFEQLLEQLTDADGLDERTEMYVRTYCSGTVLLSCDWILGKYGVNETELARIYEDALPEVLCRYLV